MPSVRSLVLVGLVMTTMIAFGSQQSISAGQEDKSYGTSEGLLPVIFATYAESNEQLQHVVTLAESLRMFGGGSKDAVVWVFLPETFGDPDPAVLMKLCKLKVEWHTSRVPESVRAYYFAGKVFAAARAEAMAESIFGVLVWMDEDTIILDEPLEFALADEIALAYRPVMHNRSGSRYDQPPDAFWSRIYDVLGIKADRLFPMTTPADLVTIRAYFNAGLIVVRPERGIFGAWIDCFTVLCADSVLAEMCRVDIEKNIFLHQTALVGAVVNRLDRHQLAELPGNYNYPLFFDRQYEAAREFGSIDNIVTLRYDTYFRNPDPDWKSKLRGPSEKVTWLTKRLGAS